MNKQVTKLTISYPNFVLDTVINPDEMNQNFLDIKLKVDEIVEQLNLRADVAYVDQVAANFTAGVIADRSIEKAKLSSTLQSEIDGILPAAKTYTDTVTNAHINATSAHGATSLLTNGRIVLRDSSGRAKIATPVEGNDIANKSYVDAVQTSLNAHTSASAPHAGHAAKNHTHSDYALKSHTHSDYSLTTHTHSDYALKSHTHSDYASKSHNHSGVYEPVLSADRKRKITISTSNPSGGSDGDIWIKY